MYRNSAHFPIALTFLPPCAADDPGQLETQIVAELDEKRRLLDAEVAQFKAQKDLEFQQFERELRSRKASHRSRTKENGLRSPGASQHCDSATTCFFDGKPATQTSGSAVRKDEQGADVFLSAQSRPAASLLSKPVVSLDRLTVNGTATPPIVHDSPLLSKVLSRSPTNLSITPPRKSLHPKPNPKREHSNADLAGLFTPAYLPLLESTRQDSSRARGSLQLPSQAKRALTAPVLLPSKSLPSALRTASGTRLLNKRKHVSFRLNDCTIVEPSSSYDEASDPDGQTAGEENQETMTKEAERTVFDSGTTSDLPQNPIIGSPRSPSPSGRLRLAVPANDDGSTVGFFELDEELDDRDEREINYHEDLNDEDCAKLPTEASEEEDLMPKAVPFTASSLPIDIVRPYGCFRSSSANL